MRIVVTGQVGLDKKEYLEQVAAVARAQGESLKIYHVGEMMYRECPDVPPGRILDLPLSRLATIRRAVFRDILNDARQHPNVIINTHATFRWKHGLFAAFDMDQLAAFNAHLYVTLVDNLESLHARLLRDHELEHTLKDIMVWREEEILATETLAKAHQQLNGAKGSHPAFLVVSRGRQPTAEMMYRLIFREEMKKAYPSFPMTHIQDLPEILAEVNRFRTQMAERFITFDPGDVEERHLVDTAIRLAKEGKQVLEMPWPIEEEDAGGAKQRRLSLRVQDLLTILPDIDGQIYARDFLLVRQSDLVISYIPELPNGKPGLSSGVERELQHAHDHGRETYIIWKPARAPSPFITQTANRVFSSVEEAMAYFDQKGYFRAHRLF